MSERLNGEKFDTGYLKNRYEINEELVYIPVGEASKQKTDQEKYDESIVDRAAIHEHAVFAATNCKQPFSTHEEIIDTVKEQEVKFGPFNLFSKNEKYTEKTKVQVPNDFWVLEIGTFHKREKEKDMEREENNTYSYCLRKDGSLFYRTETENVIIDFSGRHVNCSVWKETPTEMPLSDYFITALDHELEYKSFKEGNVTYVNHCNHSGKLLFKKKGQGLIALIDKLIE